MTGFTQQAAMPGQTVARVNGNVPRMAVTAGRKGFKADLEDLRERARRLGLGYGEVAAEVGHRHQVRPREAYRLAHGWTLGQAAARFNACAAGLGTDPDGLASLTGNRLCEYEKWPHSQRRPSVYVLVMLALVYETGVRNLLDLADHEHLPPRDRLTLLRPGPAAHAGPDLAGAAQDTSSPGLAPGLPLATAQGISLSLPYVPGRVVIEVTDPGLSTGRCAARLGGEAAQAIALPAQTPVPAAITLTAVSYGKHA
jgi:transcriptional regulator with XRE-family HTH domain